MLLGPLPQAVPLIRPPPRPSSPPSPPSSSRPALLCRPRPHQPLLHPLPRRLSPTALLSPRRQLLSHLLLWLRLLATACGRTPFRPSSSNWRGSGSRWRPQLSSAGCVRGSCQRLPPTRRSLRLPPLTAVRLLFRLSFLLSIRLRLLPRCACCRRRSSFRLSVLPLPRLSRLTWPSRQPSCLHLTPRLP